MKIEESLLLITVKQINAEQTWPIRQAVMWPDKPIDFVKLKDDNIGIHHGLYQDDVLVSVVSCFENNGEVQFRKFATLNDKQGQGLGTCLLNHVIALAKKNSIKKLWCNARTDKKSFYEKFGLIETDKRFVKEGIEFVVMEIGFFNQSGV